MKTALTGYIVALALPMCNVFVAAEGIRAPASPGGKAAVRADHAQKLTPEQLVEWLLESGHDFIYKPGRRNKLLELPFKKLPTKIDSTGKTNPVKGVQLVFRPASGSDPGKPDCLLFLWSKNYLDKLKNKSYDFRFSLDGKLERAVSSVAKRQPDGSSVRGSGVNTALDIDDPEVQERAQAELDFWLKRAAVLMAENTSKKRAGSAKTLSQKDNTVPTSGDR